MITHNQYFIFSILLFTEYYTQKLTSNNKTSIFKH